MEDGNYYGVKLAGKKLELQINPALDFIEGTQGSFYN